MEPLVIDDALGIIGGHTVARFGSNVVNHGFLQVGLGLILEMQLV